jgi:glycosyltransferase involved in cell wall biosynthesis
MKIALSYPTTYALVEKVGLLFGEVYLIGFNGPYANKEGRYGDELVKHGVTVHLVKEHYCEINPKDYDLLIDSWETRGYNPDWKEESLRWNIPRIVKILWTAFPSYLTFTDQEKLALNKSIISTENFTLEERWRAIGFQHVNTLLYPPGPWWFEDKWVGDTNKVLFILSAGPSRDTISTGLPMWKQIEQEFPQQSYHQDAVKSYLNSPKLAELCRQYRCYVNLDQGPDARPLCLVFTEAISAGIPPLIIKQPNTDYSRYIKNGVSGYICDDYQDLVDKIKILLNNKDLAQGMSNEIRKIARENFSEEVLKPMWMNTVKQAMEIV